MSITRTGLNPQKEHRLYDRTTVLRLIDVALETKSYRFARQVALGWLAAYPGDMKMSFQLAKIFRAEEKIPQAISLLEKITRQDPENLEYMSLLELTLPEQQVDKKALAKGMCFALGGSAAGLASMPDWAKQLRIARQSLASGNFEEAESMIYQVLSSQPDLPLAGIYHLRLMRLRGEHMIELKLAEMYHGRWPEALPFTLTLAERQLEMGDEARAVNLLHQCVASDMDGSVAARWWGKAHPYRPLWPERLETTMDIPVPAEVSFRMGWNRLPATRRPIPEKPAVDPASQEHRPLMMAAPVPYDAEFETSQQGPDVDAAGKIVRRPQPKSSTVMEAEAELGKFAKKVKSPGIASADGRYPVYVIFTSKTALVKEYGNKTADVILDEMKALAEVIGKRSGWGALVFCPDDPAPTSQLGVKPAAGNDPWKLKLALVDLDNALAKKGARIGALLIVGGPSVVPFHRLPNPVDDMDDEVESDNPYATLDSNYFVPEWPVGRMPGEAGPDAGLLLQQLRQSIQYHKKLVPNKRLPVLGGVFSAVGTLVKSVTRSRKVSSYGYTASVWQKTSLEAFKPVGDQKSMQASPPENSATFNLKKMTTSMVSYYNLHGLPDTNEWYGQRGPDDPVGPDYPVALSANDLQKNSHYPKVVFSEACYGGFITGKKEQDALALRFLNIGTPVFVGSTCTAYGSVSTPLIAADLLGSYFWKNLRDGFNAGEALMEAKINLVNEMTKRQGYLDGEDQKTLISFVLYGDPLRTHELPRIRSKRALRFSGPFSVKTVTDQWNSPENTEALPRDTLVQVKQVVEQYLPGIDKAEVRIAKQQVPETYRRKSLFSKKQQQKTVVTFKRPLMMAHKKYYQYARVTLDERGKMVKMAISR